MEKIKKIIVIGAGVMGAGIAAHIANSCHDVVLLDIVPPNARDNNMLTEAALNRMQTQKPPPLAHPKLISYISIGNLEDDLHLLRNCDLIIEAIVEKIEIKTNLYNKIAPYIADSTILASNTSTLRLKDLKNALPDKLKNRFLIIHFFNPPRYMPLVEVISSKNTDKEGLANIIEFLNKDLGKTIVQCNDTPGFIANRLGCFLLEMVIRLAIKEKLDIAVIDSVFNKFLGFPSTGVFGLYDLIGLDVMYLISQSLVTSLDKTDAYHEVYTNTKLIDALRNKGLIGRKAGSGFYRLNKEDKKIKEVLDLENSNATNIIYKLPAKNEYSSIEQILEGDDKYSRFFQNILPKFYQYLFNLVPAVTDNFHDIDVAMKLGYNWKWGPSELLLNHIKGGENFLKQNNVELPSNLFNDINISHNKVKILDQSPNILSNNSAQLIKYKDILVFSMKTKMNCLNIEVFELLAQSVEYAESVNRNLAIFTQGNNFSAGADLKFIIESIERQNYTNIDSFLSLGQQVMQKLKQAKINIISCGAGIALGGGTEILLHSDFIILHQEITAGLVEVSLGLIPGFGGVKEAFVRGEENKDILLNNLNNILFSNKSASANHFVHDYYLMKNTKIIMNKEYLLEETNNLRLPSKKVLDKKKSTIHIPKINLDKEIDSSKFNDYQHDLKQKLQDIIDLKLVTEEKLLELERKIFLEVCHNPEILIKLKSIIKS